MRLPRLLLCLLAAVLSAPAHAILDEISWEATRVVRVDGRVFETRVHHSRQKERIGAVVQGVALDLVLRYDTGTMYQMTPMFSLAGQTDISGADTPASIRILARDRLGEESVAGQTTVKYRVRFLARDGEQREGFYWQNAAGVHVKTRFALRDDQGQVRQVELELKELKVGPQAASLFEVPKDYRVIEVDAGMVRDLLGL
jgi:hypothetical protein